MSLSRGKKRANKKTLFPLSSEHHGRLIQIASSFNSLNRKLPPAATATAALGQSLRRRRLFFFRISLYRDSWNINRLLSPFFLSLFYTFDIRSRRFRFRRVLIGGGARTIINLRTVARRGSFRSNQIAGTLFRSLNVERWESFARSLLLASSAHGFTHCVVIRFRN